MRASALYPSKWFAKIRSSHLKITKNFTPEKPYPPTGSPRLICKQSSSTQCCGFHGDVTPSRRKRGHGIKNFEEKLTTTYISFIILSLLCRFGPIHANHQKMTPLNLSSFSLEFLPEDLEATELQPIDESLSLTPSHILASNFLPPSDEEDNLMTLPPEWKLYIEADMIVFDCDSLSDDGVTSWEDTTSNFISQQFASKFNDTHRRFYNVNSEVLLSSQTSAQLRKRRDLSHIDGYASRDIHQRIDEVRPQAGTALILSFSIELSFRSNNEHHQIDAYIEDFFVSDKVVYIWALQDTNDPQFKNLRSVAVNVKTVVNLLESTGDSSMNVDRSPYFIGLISCGAVAVTVLSVMGVRLWGKRKSHMPLDSDGSDSNGEYSVNVTTLEDNEPASTAIDVNDSSRRSIENDDSLQTDELCITGKQVPDKTTLSLKNDRCDDQPQTPKQSTMRKGLDDGSTRDYSQSHMTIFSDDSSYERMHGSGSHHIVEVVAPPGLLGIVLDTEEGETPSIYSIQEDSPLKELVKTGDKIIAVNVGLGNIDTTELSALKLSQLLSSFKAEERTIILLRDSRKTD